MSSRRIKLPACLFFAVVSVQCLRAANSGELPADSPLLKPAFSATAAELLQLANTKSMHLDGASAEILLDQGDFSVQDDGRLTLISRQIIRLATREAFDDFGVVQAPWRPWIGERPEIAARVITSSGDIYELEQATIEEIRIPSPRARVFTDTKLLRAPLPMLAVGCVVETQIVTRQHTPFSRAGAAGGFQLGTPTAPTRLTHVRVETPEDSPFHHSLLNSDASPTVRIEDGKRILTLFSESAPALVKDMELLLPTSCSPFPLIKFSTARSWRAVATEYAEIVNGQLANARLEDLARNAVESAQANSTAEIAEALLAFVHARTRYTGVSFGQAAIVPQRPSQTLQRGYGDCKDLSTLLVGLLRSVGVPADVALIKAGTGLDRLPEVPCLDGFNHAIVLVADEPPLWIDPTDRFTAFGKLPLTDQDRLALVATEHTQGLIRTPRSDSRDNRITINRVVTLWDTKTASVTTDSKYEGSAAAEMRSALADVDEKTWKDHLRQHGLNHLGTDKLDSSSRSQLTDLAACYRSKAAYSESALGWVDHPHAISVLPLYEALDFLPVDLTGHPDTSQIVSSGDRVADKKDREGPLQLPLMFRHELNYRVVAPPGFVPGKLPADRSLDLGPATLQLRHCAEEDHTVTVQVVFDSGNGKFSAAEVNAARQQIEALGEGSGYYAWRAIIPFEETAGKHLEAGRARQAIAAYADLVERHPQNPMRHVHLAGALLQVGLGDAAREHARKAVELAPNEFYSQYMLGYVLSHSRIGQQFAPGFDRPGAVAAYRKALALDPEQVGVRWEFGQLLEHDDQGLRYTNTEYVEAAIAEYASIYDQYKDENIFDSLSEAMCVLGKLDELKQLLDGQESALIRDLYLLTVVAAKDGVDKCLARAAALRNVSAERQALLEQVLQLLNRFRHYDRAKGLATRIAATSVRPAQMLSNARSLGNAARYQGSTHDTAVGLVTSMLADTFVHGPGSARLKRFFTNLPEDPDFSLATALSPWIEPIRAFPQQLNYPPYRMADIVTTLDIVAAGQVKEMWRVKVAHRLIPEITWDVFVTATPNGLRVYFAGSDYEELGAKALEMLSNEQEADARKILQWCYERHEKDLGWFDPFQGSPFARLWIAGHEQLADVKLAAAALAATSSAAEDSLRLLLAVPAEQELIKRLQVDRAIASAYVQLDAFEKLETHASAATGRHANARGFEAIRCGALGRLHKLQALELLVEKMNAPRFRNLVLFTLANAATSTGDFARAAEVLSEMKKTKDELPAEVKSLIVWLSLFQAEIPPDTLALAAEALQQSQEADFEKWTVVSATAYGAYAAALVEDGKLSEAAQALWSIPGLDTASRPNRLDRYVSARIAEQCGLAATARELYEQIEPYHRSRPNSVFDLAQQRLARMDSSR